MGYDVNENFHLGLLTVGTAEKNYNKEDIT